ncbi:MAG: TonB-dependent receptor [Inhella sp.]
MKSSSGGRDLFKVNAITAGCLVALMAGGVQAQEAQKLDTVVVTGIRKGIEDAISVKKNKDSIVEAISAEDIGKLPDTTIAEALARLPGVTTQRTRDGKASTISIRGLGPDFNGYLLNGREQTSTGDSRAADLSVYPAELIAGATVYKTGDAALLTAGLAGTIDNRLIDPLAFKNRVIAGAVEKTESGRGLEVPKGTGNRYSLSYIDQFADRKIGVALGFVRADGTAFQQTRGGWGTGTVDATLAGGGTATGVKIPDWGNGVDFKNRRVEDERTGVAAILSYKPSKEFHTQLDVFYAKIDNFAKEARIQGGLSGPITNATVQGGEAIKGTFQLGASPNGLINRHESIFQDDTLKSIGWKSKFMFAPDWAATVDLNHNSAERIERNIEAYGGILAADTLTFDRSGGGAPQFTLGRKAEYTNPSSVFIRDQSGWSGVNGLPQAGYSKGPTIKDKVKGLRVDLDHSMEGLFNNVQFGLALNKRTKDRITDEGVIASVAGNGGQPFAYPAGSYVEANIGGTGFDMLTFDPRETLWEGARIIRKFNDDILSKTWGIEEKVTTAFVKADLDTELASIPVRGNVGLQIVNTDQSSTGYRANIGSGVVLTNPAIGLSKDGTKYTDVLPSLNLSGDLGSGNVLRLAAGQQIARATLTDLRNSAAISEDKECGATQGGVCTDPTYGRFIGSAGNPHLKPFKAWALDLSYEKYFGTKAYMSAAVFYKKLDSYITTSTNLSYDFTREAQALNLQRPLSGSYTGIFTSTVNGDGGRLSGFEVAASAPFSMISSWLDGFGANFSYSDTSSSVKLPNLLGLNPNQQVPTGGNMPLPGLSKKNAKITLYFERWGFSAFVAKNYRSDYVGSVANDAIGGYPTPRLIDGSSWVSAQVGYEFQDGPAKGLAIRVEGNNLNKPVYRQLRVDGSVENENKTGADLILKLSYKL